MFAAKINDSLEEFRIDLNNLERTVSEMIKGKEMGNQSVQNSLNKLSASEQPVADFPGSLSQTPIAIVGMASLFPGAASNQAYWDNILHEVDCITDVPDSRWNSADYFDSNPRAIDKTYCKRGGFIPDIDFNPMEFGLPPNVLEATDIAQLLALVIARQAMDDAGYGPALSLNHDRTGVVLGAVGRQLSGPLWGRLQSPIWERVLKSSGLSDEDTNKVIEKLKLAYPSWQENSFPGMLSNVISGRIANRFDFGGLNCTLDAACASSLAALKMAVSELVERRADIMLTGGVDPDNSAFTYLCFSKTPALSLQQETRPFDESSDGIMLGEGVGMVVLKRLEDAERDGDRIYAVIRGLGTSSDGRYKSIYAPRPEGQVKAIERAYADAKIDPATIGLVEAHGTGTNAGDPAEFEGMNAVFGKDNPRKQHIALGSVKSQIGHTKTAAGVASMIKVAMALHHKVLPPTINIARPNPKLKIEDSPFYLNSKLRPWIRREGDVPRRAGVSSFGFGGTNFHVVLEEYQSEQAAAYRINSVPQTILLSSATPDALRERCELLLSQFKSPQADQHYVEVANTSRTLSVPLSEARLGFVSESLEDACVKLDNAIKLLAKLQQNAWEHPLGIYYRRSGLNLKGKVVALFSGQGSQYLDMGQTLATNFPVFRQTFAQHDRLLAADGLQPVSEVVYPKPVFDEESAKALKQQIRRTEYAQPAIGALSSSLYKVLQQAGFQADFTAGHSFGELTALWASGVLNDADYAFLVKARGQAMAAPAGRDFDAGAMLAVKGDAASIEATVKSLPGVSIANFNSGKQLVLAGNSSAIAQAKATLENQGFDPVPLPVSAAFHTDLVKHAQLPFSQAIEQVNFSPMQIPAYSNVTGQPYPNQPGTVKQMLQQHMVSQVQFKQEVENIYEAGGFCFVEFGPKNVLTNLVKDILGDRPHLAIATNASRHKDSDIQLREAALQLRVAGVGLGDIDPYQLPLQAPAVIPEKAKKLVVQLNGASFISPKTVQKFEASLQDDHQVDPTVTPTSTVSAVAQANGYQAFEPEKQSKAKNGSTPPNGRKNGNGNGSRVKALNGNGSKPHYSNGNGSNGNGSNGNGSNGNGSNGNGSKQHYSNSNGSNGHGSRNSVASQNGSNRYADSASGVPGHGEVAPARCQPSVAAGTTPLAASSTVNSPSQEAQFKKEVTPLKQSSPEIAKTNPALSQVSQHQKHILDIHSRYLDVHQEYTRAFAQITQQQQQLLAQQSNHELIASTERSLMAFHEHQRDTLRVHEQYLLGQVAFSGLAQGAAQTEQRIAPQPLAATTQVGKMQPVVKQEPGIPASTSSQPTVQPLADAAIVTTAPVGDDSSAVVQPTLESTVILPSTVAQPAASAAYVPVGILSAKLLEVVSDKTGYPTEMLELDMDMEADLGIDSIKRVEILGALQEAFPELPQPNLEELAEIEMRTLGQVADYMGQLGGNDATAAPTSTPSAATALAVETPSEVVLPSCAVELASQTSSVDAGEMEQKLLEVVSDKTGYPTEMLELDMDMEADLGIDSIKRVEILGALQEAFPELPQPNLEELAEIEMRTLGQVADYMSQLGKPSPDGESKMGPDSTCKGDGGTSTPQLEMPSPSSPVATPPTNLPSFKQPSSPVVATPARPAIAGYAPELQPHSAVAVLERPTQAPSTSRSLSAISAETIQSTLLEVVSDKTGYPAEMLELDMDMEADLGIDSIKRVEILGALQEAFPELPQPNLEELAEIEMRTLGQVADYMAQLSPNSPAAALASVAGTPIAQPEVSVSVSTEVTAAPAISAETMQSTLLEVVSDKTGYPAEMLELDMDMEADLGIDSIKRVEILGALQEAFPELPQPNLEELAEIEMRTLGQVADYMQSLSASVAEKKNQPEVKFSIPTVLPSSAAQPPESIPLPALPLPRHPAQLQSLPPADWLDFELPLGHVCLVTDDGTATTTHLVGQLSQKGWKVVVLSFPQTLVGKRATLPAGVERVVLAQLGDSALGQQLQTIASTHGTPAAFIHLHPQSIGNAGLRFPESEATLVRQIFFLAKHLKTPLSQSSQLGRSIFMTVAHLDGSFALSGQGGFNPIPAGLAGLTKTLNFEWRSVYCRALDLSPQLDASQAVNCILSELHDPDGLLPEVGYSDRGRVTLVAGN